MRENWECIVWKEYTGCIALYCIILYFVGGIIVLCYMDFFHYSVWMCCVDVCFREGSLVDVQNRKYYSDSSIFKNVGDLFTVFEVFVCLNVIC